MLDELLGFDRDGSRGAGAAERPRGIRGFFGRLLGSFGDQEDNDDDRRGDRRRSDRDDDDDDERRPAGDRQRRRRDNDAFEFGDD